jgi:hypothetical protein
MELKTKCFVLSCKESVIRKPDDYLNVYCEYHEQYRLSNYDYNYSKNLIK